MCNASVNIQIKIHEKLGGSSEWLGRRTLNPEVAGSSPALTTWLELFLVDPSSTPRPSSLPPASWDS